MTYFLAIKPGTLIPDPGVDLSGAPDDTIVHTLEDMPQLKAAQQRYEARKFLSQLAALRLSTARVTPKQADNLLELFVTSGKVQLKNYTEPIEFPQVALILNEAHRARKAGLLSAVYIEKMKINRKIRVIRANDAQRTMTSMLFAEVKDVRGNVQKYLLALWNDADDILSPTEIDDLRGIRQMAAPVTSPAADDYSPRPAKVHDQAPSKHFMRVLLMTLALAVLFPLIMSAVVFVFNSIDTIGNSKYLQMNAPFCHIEHVKCMKTSGK